MGQRGLETPPGPCVNGHFLDAASGTCDPHYRTKDNKSLPCAQVVGGKRPLVITEALQAINYVKGQQYLEVRV